jgi:alpha-beta hydrolase superfamily lysophospholipase
MSAVRRLRTVTPVLPSETGRLEGLAYTLWLPHGGDPPHGGVVVLHGAGSCKESHYDFARAAIATGLAAICFDQRGHGESDGPMDGRAAHDVAAVAARLREAVGEPRLPVALRGSSMGGYLAIAAAPAAHAAAVVAICPAPGELLRAGLAHGAFEFAVDVPSLDAFLAGHDLSDAIAELTEPVLILHADGDERVPVQSSRELEGRLRNPASRLIVVPGGHHRSIQHDNELQAVSLRFIGRALAVSGEPG